MAAFAHAAGAADAVEVVAGVGGEVDVDDVADAFDVQAAGGDIGCDEHFDCTVAKLVERGLPFEFTQACMEHGDAQVPAFEIGPELFGAFVAVDKGDGALGAGGFDEVVERARFVVVARFDVAVLNGWHDWLSLLFRAGCESRALCLSSFNGRY